MKTRLLEKLQLISERTNNGTLATTQYGQMHLKILSKEFCISLLISSTNCKAFETYVFFYDNVLWLNILYYIGDK
jgi:hypothetical protein